MKKLSIIVMLIVALTVCMAVPTMASAAPAEANTDGIVQDQGQTQDQEQKPEQQEQKQDQNEDEDDNDVPEIPMLDETVVKTTILSSQSMSVKWDRVYNAKSYRVAVYSGNYRYRRVNTKKRTLTFKNLPKGKKYQVVVKALPKNSSYEASKSNTIVKLPQKITRNMRGFNKTNAGKMLKIAESKLGYSYVSGGSGPRVFDCSGYVYYITKRAYGAGYTNRKLRRSSDAGERAQMRRMKGSKYVGRSYSKAQPGDIVFMGGHVAFYYGNNKLIHASNPRVDVAITSIWWSGGPARVKAIYRLPEM